MNILSFPRKPKILVTIILSILLFLLLVAGYFISTIFLSFQDGGFATDWLTSALIILLMIMLIVLVLMFVYRIIIIWSYSIQFNDVFLEAHMARIPFAQTFKCVYADISAVRMPMQGVIEIVPREGKPLRFAPAAFDGGEEKAFRLLSQYIPSERFETVLPESPKYVVSRSMKIFYAVMLFLMLCYVSLLIFQAPSSLIPVPLSWNYFGPWSSDFISGFSVESPDSVWLTSRSYLPSRSVVQHVFAGKTETWHLSTERFHEFDDLQNLILVSAHQQPVLVAEKAVYFMKNGQWEKTDYQAGYQYDDDRRSSAFVADTWLPLSSSDQSLLVHIQADNPQPEVVTLEDPVTQKFISPSLVRTAANGTVLLQAETTIYTLRDGKLQQQRYLVVGRKESAWIRDFVLADDDSLYVLVRDADEYFVKRITREGTQTSTQLPDIPQNGTWGGAYDSIEVDSRGRLWVTWLFDMIGVFEPKWNGVAQKIVVYDNYNSNFQDGLSTKPFRTSNGRIWSANHHLIWIDSNLAELPAPLPDWLAQIRRPNLLVFAIPITVSISLIVVALKSRKNKR